VDLTGFLPAVPPRRGKGNHAARTLNWGMDSNDSVQYCQRIEGLIDHNQRRAVALA